MNRRLHNLVRLERCRRRVARALRTGLRWRRRRERVDLPVERRRMASVDIAAGALVRLLVLVALRRVR